MQKFKIRCSQISKIMGRIGLTEKQESDLLELTAKPKLTDKQKQYLADLAEKKANPTLPETCITYLKEWYAEQVYDDREDIKSKYFDKGNLMEESAINFSGVMLGLGLLDKNEEEFENEWLTGTPDVITKNMILDTKCPWSGKTFLDSVLSPLSDAYEWQMIGYMWLTDKPLAKVCFCLMDTPDFVNFGKAVTYDEVPSNFKFHAKSVEKSEEKENQIKERVGLCRKWLENYHNQVLEALA